MKIIDWNKKETLENEEIVKQSNWGTYISDPDEFVKGYAFLNFPKISFGDHKVVDCVFENCGTVAFEECKVKRCTFKNAGSIELTNADIEDSVFRDIHFSSDYEDGLIQMEDSEISGCTFENIEITNDSYLFEGSGSNLVEKSKFVNISTDREDEEIEYQTETRGLIFKKTVDIAIIDIYSCEGLGDIICTWEDEEDEDEDEGDEYDEEDEIDEDDEGDEKDEGSSENTEIPGYLTRLMERGLVTRKECETIVKASKIMADLEKEMNRNENED